LPSSPASCPWSLLSPAGQSWSASPARRQDGCARPLVRGAAKDAGLFAKAIGGIGKITGLQDLTKSLGEYATAKAAAARGSLANLFKGGGTAAAAGDADNALLGGEGAAEDEMASHWARMKALAVKGMSDLRSTISGLASNIFSRIKDSGTRASCRCRTSES